MGNTRSYPPVKLVIGTLSSPGDHYAFVLEDLTQIYGICDYSSDPLDFTYTEYYHAEMGEGLVRRFHSFGPLIDRTKLPDIKLHTNALEEKYAVNGKRRVNLDPGYIELGKFILATTKDQQHRIYLRDGIFAEITLRFCNKSFCAWEWTYRDYQTPEYIGILNKIREQYYEQLHAEVNIDK